MSDHSFRRFGGGCAIGAAVLLGLFAISQRPEQLERLTAAPGAVLLQRLFDPSANLLLVGVGVLTTAAVYALHDRLRANGPAWSGWAATLGVVGSLLTALHGLWDAIRIPAMLAQWATDEPSRQAAVAVIQHLPNPADPRGFGTFLLVGLFALVAGRLMLADERWPDELGHLGLLYGLLLVGLFVVSVLQLGASARLLLGGLAMGIVGPLWWLAAGWQLVREQR